MGTYIESRRELLMAGPTSTNALFCHAPSTASSTYSKSDVVRVPIICRQQDSTLRFEASYALVLQPYLTRAEYYQVVNELNRVCQAHAPVLTCKGCCVWFIPFFGCYLMWNFKAALDRFEKALREACGELSVRFAGQGVTFHCRQLMKVTVAEAQTLFVEMELRSPS